MFHYISWLIYVQPLGCIILFILASVFLWSVLGAYAGRSRRRSRVWKIWNLVFFLLSTASIWYLTIFNRVSVETLEAMRNAPLEREFIRIPFYSFQEARVQPELYRSMLMNIYLFVPFGLSLPWVLQGKCRKTVCVAVTVTIGLLLSISIEALQYYTGLGRSEVDDVIMNTLGCLLGALSYVFVKFSK